MSVSINLCPSKITETDMSTDFNTTAIFWQRLEGALVFIFGLVLYAQAEAELSIWLVILAFFAPDLSFLGYTLGPKTGAVAYNIVHLYGFGAVVVMAGTFLGLPLLAALGALWLAHTGFDRLLGYGLKSETSFGLTHLGRIGRTA